MRFQQRSRAQKELFTPRKEIDRDQIIQCEEIIQSGEKKSILSKRSRLPSSPLAKFFEQNSEMIENHQKSICQLQNEFHIRDRYQSLVVHDLRTPSQSISFATDMQIDKIRRFLSQIKTKILFLNSQNHILIGDRNLMLNIPFVPIQEEEKLQESLLPQIQMQGGHQENLRPQALDIQQDIQIPQNSIRLIQPLENEDLDEIDLDIDEDIQFQEPKAENFNQNILW